MALIKYKLGSLITQSELRNSDNAYTVESVVGLSTQKQTIKTKADMEGVSLTSYKLTSATFHCRSGNRPSPGHSRAGRSHRPACAPERPG